MKKNPLKNIKVIPDHTVLYEKKKWFFEGQQLDIEMLDQLASEAEVFKGTYLYKMWQGFIRTNAITAIVKDSKDFNDVQNGKALLIALDRLENMMSDIIKQQKEIGNNKK